MENVEGDGNEAHGPRRHCMTMGEGPCNFMLNLRAEGGQRENRIGAALLLQPATVSS